MDKSKSLERITRALEGRNEEQLFHEAVSVLELVRGPNSSALQALRDDAKQIRSRGMGPLQLRTAGRAALKSLQADVEAGLVGNLRPQSGAERPRCC